MTSRAGRQPLMAGNWKMNVNHLEAIALTQKIAFSLSKDELDAVDVVLLPPFTDLRSVQTLVDADNLRLTYGAQDLSPRDSGAFTGDISGAMLAKLGCTYALVGHSERREHHREDDAIVRSKVEAAVRHGLTPLLCVGEGLEVRQAGDHVAHCTAQLAAALQGLSVQPSWVMAYEPVWAIGTGEVAGPDDAQEVCAALRAKLVELAGPEVAAAVRVLYGGSVKPDNVADLLAQPDVDGALVGGASLDAEQFAEICRPARS